MRLRNKKTGEIIENAYIRESHDFYNKRTIAVFVRDGSRPPERVSTGYETLAELNEEWEDYEEPKRGWYLDGLGHPIKIVFGGDDFRQTIKAIGNYFETEEEAEKAVRKLKAWKRLKDKGCRFMLDDYFAVKLVGLDVTKIKSSEEQKSLTDDYKLLFGGEE